MVLAKYMMFLQKDDIIYYTLNSGTTHRIFQNADEEFKREFVGLFNSKAISNFPQKESISNVLNMWSLYSQIESNISSERLLHIFNLIKDNETDHLRSIIESSGYAGIAQVKFSNLYHEQALKLAGEGGILISELNPIHAAIKYKSLNCLSYLVDTFGLR